MCSKENLHQIKAVHTTSTFQDARSEDDERLKVTAWMASIDLPNSHNMGSTRGFLVPHMGRAREEKHYVELDKLKTFNLNLLLIGMYHGKLSKVKY